MASAGRIREVNDGGEPLSWVPMDACTLPTAEQPFRLAEFDDLFTSALQRVDRVAPTRLRLELAATAEAKARDLAARESECCSFFTFTFGADGSDTVRMDIDVPTGRVDVLDGVVAQIVRTA